MDISEIAQSVEFYLVIAGDVYIVENLEKGMNSWERNEIGGLTIDLRCKHHYNGAWYKDVIVVSGEQHVYHTLKAAAKAALVHYRKVRSNICAQLDQVGETITYLEDARDG